MYRKYLFTGLLVIVIISIVAYNNRSSSPSLLQGSFSTDIAGLTEAKSSETVELKNGDSYNLTASIVKKTIGNNVVKMLAYNGMIPGPLIKVAQGSEVTINFKNETDVPTTLHSHGIRLDNKFDGVPDVTQKEVGIGESFTYKIKFPDEGIYWYHPHIREDYAQESGLYGNYFVVGNDAGKRPPVNREIPLMVDDILLEDGKIAPFPKDTVDRTLMGRFGNTMLVNGETNYNLSVTSGEVIRFYFTNAANTRVFNLFIPGTRMKLVGQDAGLMSRQEFVESVIISPSERYIVDVYFEKPGTYTLTHTTPDKTYTMGTIAVGNGTKTPSYVREFSTLLWNTDIATVIPNLEQYYAKPADKSLTLSIDMKAMGNMNMGGMDMAGMTGESDDEKIEWEETNAMMNTMSNKENVTWKLIDDATKKENMDIDWQFKKGDFVKLRLFNDPKSAHPMQHPIHIHGQRVVVLSTNGVRNDNPVFKDTVLVQKGDTVDVLVEVSNPGQWLIHCHIPEHMEAGMMSEFEVI